MPERADRLRARFASLKIDGLLLFDMKNIRYLTGFTGSDGLCLIRSNGNDVLFIDGRYVTQAKEQVPGMAVQCYKDKVAGLAAELSASSDKVTGFESTAVTFDMHRQLRKALKGIALKPMGDALWSLRSVKDGTEVERISRAIDISHRALRDILVDLRPGVMERDIAVALDHRMKMLGADEASFPTIVASGPHAAMPHAAPGSRRIQPGDAVIIDYGAVVEGYHSDETCTFIVGHANGRINDVYATVKEAHDRAIAAIQPGVSCREIDRIARCYISDRGFGDFFPHGTGHGVGLDVHEAPRLSPTADAVLAPGMVVTVEPGIYLPGEWGIRIEDMILVEETGCRVLTKTSKMLDIIQ